MMWCPVTSVRKVHNRYFTYSFCQKFSGILKYFYVRVVKNVCSDMHCFWFHVLFFFYYLWVLQLIIRFPPLSAALKAAGSEGSEVVKVTDSDPPTLTVHQTTPQTEAGNHGDFTVETAQPESCE